ncbi:MAG: arabinofuranosyltransferase, partial [Kiritimatiellia bacterium]
RVASSGVESCPVLWAGVTVDDSYISYRYAENLAGGYGLVFNHGEWVEGFSNPLWVLLLALFATVGIPATFSAKLLGLASGLGAIVYAWQIGRYTLRLPVAVLSLMMLWLSTSTAFYVYASGGMETIFYSLTIIGMSAHLARRQDWAAAGWAAAAVITRPEGVLFVGPLVLALLWGRRWRSLPALAFPVITTLGWRLTRWVLYNDVYPNTWHAKNYAKLELAQRLERNWNGAIADTWGAFSNLLSSGLGLAFFVIGCVLLASKSRTVALALTPLCLFALVWVGGRDWMSLTRFYVPAVPVAAVLVFAGLNVVYEGRQRWASAGAVAVALCMIGLNISQGYQVAVDLPKAHRHNPAMDASGHAALGLWLRERVKPDDVVLINEIGAVGYLADVRILDSNGLIHRDIPQLWRHNYRSLVDTLMKKYPNYIALHDHKSPHDSEMYSRDVRLHRWMGRSGMYEKRATIPLAPWRSYVVYKRIVEPPARGQGLLGRYEGQGKVHERLDGLVHFNWEGGSAFDDLPRDGFNVVWRGCVIVDKPRFIFGMASGAVKVTLDGERVLKTGHGTNAKAQSERAVEAGVYPIEVEYSAKTGDASVTLSWSEHRRGPMVAIPGSALVAPGGRDGVDCAPAP